MLSGDIRSTDILFPATSGRRVYLHVLFWVVFVLYHLLPFIPFTAQQHVTMEMTFSYILYYARFIPIFYGSLLVYHYLEKIINRPLLWMMVLASSIIITHLLTVVMFLFADAWFGIHEGTPAFKKLGEAYLAPFTRLEGKNLLLFIYDVQDIQLLILPVGIKMFKFGIEHERARLNLQTEQLKSELNNLRSQLSPHFVFNVINAAVSQVLPFSQKAAGYLGKMSEILRFTLYEATEETISLQKEITCIKRLVALESMRNINRSKITVSQKGKIRPADKIPTLLLISLVENAFKHGVHATYQSSMVKIQILLTENELDFRIENSKPDLKIEYNQDKSHSGIGLKNISKRLDLLFPGKHQFAIIETSEIFKVQLIIPLALNK